MKTANDPRKNLIRAIEARISAGQLAPGTRLPSLRELAGEFSLTVSGVRRSLETLCERGVLESRHGSGIYVRAHRDSTKPEAACRVTVFVSGEDRSRDYCAHALAGVRKAAENGNTAVNFDIVSCHLQQLRSRQLALPEPDALILLGCYDLNLPELPGNCPAVGLEMHDNYGGRLSTVALDPLAAARTATDYFLAGGFDRVTVFTSELPSYQFRADIFCSTFRRAGGECGLIPYHQAGMECLKDAGSGYLFIGDSIAQLFAQEYRAATGRFLAADRKILGLDGKRRLFPNYEPFPSVSLDWQYAGRIVLEECVRRIVRPGLPARRIYLCGTLDEA